MRNCLLIDYAEIPDNYAEIMHRLRSHYTKIMQTLHSHYAEITQRLRRDYAEITQLHESTKYAPQWATC